MKNELKEDLTKYAINLNANQDIITWLEKWSKDIKDLNEGEHIIDYLINKTIKLEKATYKQIKSNTDKWTKSLIKKGKHIKETKEDLKIIIDFKDGFKAVKLIGKNAYKREGFLMSHCVESYYSQDDNIYSIRDKNNMPHATLSKSSNQIKGKGNGSIHPKYIEYVVKLLKYLKVEVRDSEMQNLGYYNVLEWKKYLNKETKDNLFMKRYWYSKDELLDKKGNHFYCLDMLDKIPLISEANNNLKINFNLDEFIQGSLDFLFNKTKISSGNYSKLASSGNYSQLASSGDYSQLASSGNYSQLASSGNYSQLASSGDDSKLASSGDDSKLASSGDSFQLASSGDSSQLASSGDDSQLASSGDSSKLTSSGHNSQLASSGDYSKLASSGGSSQLASSGTYSKLASSGPNSHLELKGIQSVGANIGYKGKIKGIVGTWITLAEYDSEYKIKFVKSGQIDGVKLKENVWYELKNKKFVEVKT